MARKKREPEAKPAAGWITTFSDLMNLLLCFFVLLFSMSTVDAEKFQMVIASLQSSLSVMPAGSMSIGEGEMVGNGISQLPNIDVYFETSSGEDGDSQGGKTDESETETDVAEQYKEQALAESEQMAEQIEQQIATNGLQNQVEVDFNAEYVKLTLNGAILFDSAKANIREDAQPLIAKIGTILESYDSNVIEIEGHTDNVPIHSSKYENNNVLSMYRALSVADFIRDNTTLDPALIKSSGRGEYVPVADNTTEEGRARNRRVEIKVYNTYNSDGATE
ncbi:MAG: flagellar motor protein MotB [Lachnospiraceae bacterium]|nr:flagellar motor protein MotB [Lachnospiraceae bacterium]